MKVLQWWRRLDLAETESSKYRMLRREVVESVSGFGTSLPAFYMRRLGLRIVPQEKYRSDPFRISPSRRII
jgi:hypothetical protein